MTTPSVAAGAYASARPPRRSRPPRSARPPAARRARARASARCSRTRSAPSSKPAASRTPRRQAMAAGKANIVDVVTAVAETEVAVEALVSVRDKMIQAYEEIMRMPI